MLSNGFFGLVVLDDVVLDSGFVGLGENLLPVDDAAADRGQVDGVAEILRAAGGDFGNLLEVFDVDQREASGIAVEIFDGIGSGSGDPARDPFPSSPDWRRTV